MTIYGTGYDDRVERARVKMAGLSRKEVRDLVFPDLGRYAVVMGDYDTTDTKIRDGGTLRGYSFTRDGASTWCHVTLEYDNGLRTPMRVVPTAVVFIEQAAH